MTDTDAPQTMLRLTGGNIARFRAERGLTIEELAQRVPVDPATLAEIEGGRADFDIDMLSAIADALETEAYRLVMPEDADGTAEAAPAL